MYFRLQIGNFKAAINNAQKFSIIIIAYHKHSNYLYQFMCNNLRPYNNLEMLYRM